MRPSIASLVGRRAGFCNTDVPQTRRQGVKILVIEDNQVVQQGLVRALGREGFAVTAVGDAISALTALESTLFDVILCDIKLPLIDGLRLYEQIVEDHPSLSNRVVFVTAMVNDPKIRSFLDRTGRPVVAKPFELQELLAVVRDVSRKSVQPDQPILGLPGADREIARGLPAEFLATPGAPAERLTVLVDRHWPKTPEADRRQLEQMLLMVLEPLVNKRKVTEALRRKCEEVVRGWAVRQ